MTRAFTIAFFIMSIMFSMNLIWQANVCYQYGYNAVNQVGGYNLNACPLDAVGVGHPLFPLEATPMFGYDLVDADNNVIDPSNATAYNMTMRNAVTYNPAPFGLTDTLGFFSWIVGGAKFIVNTFLMPLYGFPQFLQKFYVPAFVTTPIGVLLFAIQIIGLYEFFSGREVFHI